MALTETLIQTRRRIVKRAGLRFIKSSADLMARQSLVADRRQDDGRGGAAELTVIATPPPRP